MTVSCNCQDFDGQGRIGDLREQTLGEVFESHRVQEFQEMLLAGTFPTDVCGRCDELVRMKAGASPPRELFGRVPQAGLMVENTARCNLRCALCDREMIIEHRRQPSLTLADVTVIATMLKEHSIRRVSYFNLGEPFLSPRIHQELQLIRDLNPDIEIWTSTNGVFLEGPDKVEAALMMDYVVVSIDGVDQESAERYQSGTDFDRALQNLSALTRARFERGRRGARTQLPVVEWKYVLFNWNDSPEQLQSAARMAREAGVDLIGFYPGFAPAHEQSRQRRIDVHLPQAEHRSDGSWVIWFNEAARSVV